MAVAAFPFLTLSDEHLESAEWLIGDPGLPLHPMEEFYPNWDYSRDIEISVALELNMPGCADALQIPLQDLRLAAVLSAGTGSGIVPRRIARLGTGILSESMPSCRVTGRLPGKAFSGRLLAEMQLVLEAPLGGGSALSPKASGARLWRDQMDILLESAAESRFPIEVVDFSLTFHGMPQQHAPWYLHWQERDIEADFSGNVRLYLNSGIAGVRDRLAEGEDLLFQAIMGNVMQQMISATILEDGSEDLLASCPRGSVGYQVREWTSMAFPGQSLDTIRSIHQAYPGRFSAAILAAAATEGGQ